MHTGSVKVVLDTNIVISASLGKEGNPAKIFELAIEGKLENFTSNALLEEVRGVFGREKISAIIAPENAKKFLGMYMEISTLIHPKHEHKLVLADHSDNKIVDCAMEAKAEYIITGDEHLLLLKGYKGIQILSPKSFLEKMRLG